MLKIDRQRYIEDELKKYGSILISSISEKLSCSEETIRRDLKELENQGKLKRIHGGAFLPDSEDKGVPIILRETFISDVKDKLSIYVVNNIINNGDTLMLDSSTTCLSLAKHLLLSNKKVVIITNSLRIMDLFRDQVTPIKIIGIGGNFKQKTGSFTGNQSIQSIKTYVADKSFISSSALDKKHGIVDSNINEGQVRATFIDHSRKTYLVVDHTKLQDTADYIVAPLTTVESIITDRPVDSSWSHILEKLNIKVEYC